MRCACGTGKEYACGGERALGPGRTVFRRRAVSNDPRSEGTREHAAGAHSQCLSAVALRKSARNKQRDARTCRNTYIQIPYYLPCRKGGVEGRREQRSQTIEAHLLLLRRGLLGRCLLCGLLHSHFGWTLVTAIVLGQADRLCTSTGRDFGGEGEGRSAFVRYCLHFFMYKTATHQSTTKRQFHLAHSTSTIARTSHSRCQRRERAERRARKPSAARRRARARDSSSRWAASHRC